MAARTQYVWSELGEAVLGKLTTPERLAKELERFKRPEGFRPREILEDAKKPGSYFHPLLDWDDKKEAEKHRLSRIRFIIAAVRLKRSVTVEDEDSAADQRRLPPPRAILAVKSDHFAYHDVKAIQQSAELQERLLEQVDRELQAIADRHRH